MTHPMQDDSVTADEVLVQRCQQGDKQAFELLTRRHGPHLSRWISSLTWDRDEGENLSQEALTRAYTQLDQFRPGHQFSSWLNGIALNLCRHHLRSRARHASIVDPAIFRDVSPQEHQGVLSGIVSREQWTMPSRPFKTCQ